MVCVPLSTLENWAFEFEKWAPTINVVVYKVCCSCFLFFECDFGIKHDALLFQGNKNERKEIYMNEIAPGQFNVVITTPEFVIRDASRLKRRQWFYLICDEGHRMKNSQSKLGNGKKKKNRLFFFQFICFSLFADTIIYVQCLERIFKLIVD